MGCNVSRRNRIRQQIIRPTAVQYVLVFPIFDRGAKILKTLLLVATLASTVEDVILGCKAYHSLYSLSICTSPGI